jgi:hypothetical protein
MGGPLYCGIDGLLCRGVGGILCAEYPVDGYFIAAMPNPLGIEVGVPLLLIYKKEGGQKTMLHN